MRYTQGMNTNKKEIKWTVHHKGQSVVVYTDGSERILTDADQVIVSREYTLVDQARCGCDHVKVMVTVYADGRTSQSKCGRCYL